MPSPALPARLLVTVPLALAGLALAGCGNGSGTAGAATEVAVSAKDDACEVADTSLDAGTTTFAVTNDGSKVTEVYVYAESGSGEFTKVVSEVENIGPGTRRDLTAKLASGTYEVACKPGQQGDGIRQRVTVTGEGGGSSASGSGSGEGYDREVELTVDDSGLHGLDRATAATGERIEVKLENGTAGPRTLEVVAPDGTVAAEFDVAPGKDGEAVVELADAGAWSVKVEGGPSDIAATLTVG